MANQQTVCRFYLQGKCTYGSKCRFAHPPNRGGNNASRFDNGRNWDRMEGGNRFNEADYTGTNWRGGSNNWRGGGGGNNWRGGGRGGNNWQGGGGNNWRGGSGGGNNWRGGSGGGNNWRGGRGGGWQSGGVSNWDRQGDTNWRGGSNNWRGGSGRGSNNWSGQGSGNNWIEQGRGNNWRGGSGSNNWRGGGRGGDSWQGGGGRGNWISDTTSTGGSSLSWHMTDNDDMNIDDNIPPTADKIVMIIKQDMMIWERSDLWPLSCYTPYHMCPNLPDLQDHSMEELRYLAYQSVNNLQQYLDTYRKLYDQQKLLWNRYQSITPDEITQFIKSRQSGTTTTTTNQATTYDRTPATTTISRNPFHTTNTHTTPVKDLFGVKEMKQNQSVSSLTTTVTTHKLTQAEIDSYKAPRFVAGQIPETPPTDDLCN